MRKVLFPLVLVCLLAASASAQTSVSVDESGIRARFDGGRLKVSIPIASGGEGRGAARVETRLLDPSGRAYATDSREMPVSPTSAVAEVSLPLGGRHDVEDLLTDRLEYRVAVGGSAPAVGIVALGRVLEGLFQLNAMTVEDVFAGASLPVHVRAVDPFTGAPVAGVRVDAMLKGDLESDDDETPKLVASKASVVTDADGYAELLFAVPAGLDDDLEIELRGDLNGLTTESREDLELTSPRTNTFFLLDKPIYQPGQIVRFRALLLRSSPGDSGYVVEPDRELEFVVRDEDNLTLYKARTKSSRFGIVNGEWRIPADAKLGNYSLETSIDEYGDDETISFKVSRYELPNFVVAAKPYKTFYLPDDPTAEVTVSAAYLFGKPVAAGKVRVVRESSRSWNFKKQKWDIDEAEAFEGETDADGKFVAKIPLLERHKSLADSSWRNSDDETLTAYFTDSTSNRTEEVRFDLRVSKKPIHVYVRVRGERHDPRLPFTALIRTLAADGTPCACRFTISGRADRSVDGFLKIAEGVANKDGIAIVEFLTPSKIAESDENLELRVEAAGSEGRNGEVVEEVTLDDQSVDLMIRTDKALYAPGAPIRVRIDATVPDATVVVDVLRNGSGVGRARVRLSRGRAEAVVPYDKAFQGKLTVVAALSEGPGSDSIKTSSESVVYPWPRALAVTAKPARGEYRPGGEGRLDLSVAKKGGTSESALGVVVIDRAVEERARVDTRFGRPRGILDAFTEFDGKTWSDIPPSKITPDLQIAARHALSVGEWSYETFDSSGSRNPQSVFSKFSERQFEPFRVALGEHFRRTLQYPKDEKTMQAVAAEAGLDFGSLRDPWGMPYYTKTGFGWREETLSIRSGGPDKRIGTDDDYTAFSRSFPWFAETEDKIRAAVEEYRRQTGAFVLDPDALARATALRGIDVAGLLDPWGTPLRARFELSGNVMEIRFISAGPDKTFENQGYADDFAVAWILVPYFADTEQAINVALATPLVRSTFPTTIPDFQKALRARGIDTDLIRDGFGRPVFISYREEQRYIDRISVESIIARDGTLMERKTITPVTQKIGIFQLRTVGDVEGSAIPDWRLPSRDIVIARFVGVITEQTKNDAVPQVVEIPAAKPAEMPRVETIVGNGEASIVVAVNDANGAVVAGALVQARRKEDGEVVAQSATNSEGIARLAGIPAGIYRVRVEMIGFKFAEFVEVVVNRGDTIRIKSTLEVGSVEETVTVSSESAVLETTSSSIASVKTIDGLPSQGNADAKPGRDAAKNPPKRSADTESESVQTDTPRVRQYFPETLYWAPEILTNPDGKASVKFRLGDNITTWNVYAVASDTNGRVGLARSEFKTFQPFFVDLDAPKFLTTGDEIYLPSQVRNYSDRPASVAVSMDKPDWLEFLDAGARKVEVPAGETVIAVFGFRAVKPAREGRQRVTALAGKNNDAVEKPVTVRPDGEEITATESFVVNGVAKTEMAFPSAAIPETRRVVLKLYPNMIGHVVDAVDGLLKRPYGCAEQTISSTYPNLMILKIATRTGAVQEKLMTAARANLRRGYEKLLGFQRRDGGFGYWNPDSEADIALTAYAVRFLTEADGEIEVDEEVISNAVGFLLRMQSADGGFEIRYSWEKGSDPRRTQMTTAYVARVLGSLKAAGRTSKNADEALVKALGFIKVKNDSMFEPYTLAVYGLAALDAGLEAEAATVAQSLREKAIREADRVYWNLETNTPFYGWGTPGRLETTALVAQFLTRVNDPRDKALLGGATMFLLKNKDRFGVWHSTQATINVLEALLASFGKTTAATVRLRAGGRDLAPIPIRPDQIEPIAVELPADAPDVEIDAGAAGSQLMAQIVRNHYVAWKDSESNARNVNQSRAVRLEYNCDKTDVKIMETVKCHVEAERIGFRGYGMLLAEIGIPPGAEVSRESLDEAVRTASGLSRYEILPDRIVVYTWAVPGGTNFDFTFKPRYAIKAKTPASLLYDYYNEEARAVVMPMRFEVR